MLGFSFSIPDLAARRGGGAPILDQIATASIGAYSTRRLRSAYAGSALRVRRSSDSAEQDIGFVGNALDTASMLTFCGAGDGFVVTWYDQSGNARNITQATTALQPRIVNAGVSLGAARIDSGTIQRLTITNAAFGLASSALTVCSAMKAIGAGGTAMGLIYGIGSVAGARIYPGTSASGLDLICRPSGTNIAASPTQTFSGSACTLALTKTATANQSAISTRLNNGSASTYGAAAIAATDNTFGINNTSTSTVSGIHEHYEHLVFAAELSAGDLSNIARNQAAAFGISGVA